MRSKNIVFTEPYKTELLSEELKLLGEKDVLVRLAISTISTGTEKANLVGEVNTSVYSNRTVAHFPGRVGYSSADLVQEIHSVNDYAEVFDRLAREKGFPVVQLDWRDLK